MRSVRPIFSLLLAAAGALAVLSGGAVANGEGGWHEISRLDIIVNIAQRTSVEIYFARETVTERGIQIQEAWFTEGDAKGFPRVEKWLNTSFTLSNDDPAMGGKSMRDRALITLDDYSSDATVELVKKLKIPGGVGHAAYVRGNEHRCMAGESAHSLEMGDSRSGTYDTQVTIAYCDLDGRAEEIVNFLRNLRLVTREDNREAYGIQ